MNRSQRRARWQSQFRRRNADVDAPTGEPTASSAGVAPRNSPVVLQQPRTVRVNIEQLELRGFERSSARSIADALGHQLSLLFSARGIPPGWMRTQRTDVEHTQDVMHVSSGTSPRAIGDRVAKAVFELRAGDRT